MHYVIIGNGGAGTSALTTIREVDRDSDITILSREKYPAYSPCSLPNLLSGELEKSKIFRFPDTFYDQHDAAFLRNTSALSISPGTKEISLSNGERLKYDKLLISAGARPIIPREMEGLDLRGVHVMGTLDSTVAIIDHLQREAKEAVVIGGGFMGIETATMLRKRGIEVTVVELLPSILSRMLDTDVSRKVEEIIRRNGVNLLLNRAVTAVQGTHDVQGVKIGKRTIPCDMVVVAIGVAPNLRVVKGSGIRTDRGIIVDRHMRTNRTNIYAAGDITEVTDRISGTHGTHAIWPNAIEQGRVAGLNMAGVPSSYEGAEVVNILDVFGTPVITMGGTSRTLRKCRSIVREYPHSYRKLLVKENRIMGLQFLGEVRNTGPFYSFMKEGTDVTSVMDRLLDDNFVHLPDAMGS